MAIYKPSNCAPFMETWDLDKPQVITCELNTNNVPVTGYKLKIFDSKNEPVYEDKEFKPLPDGYTGLNESELKIPFEPYNKDKNTAGFKTDEKGEPLLRNNYPYQPYKWQITLAQGQITDGGFSQLPTNNDAYDMTVVSGTIIGSTKDRIQSKLSEEIYADYFIQLYDDKKTTVGERVLIESYDHTYGYLYPQKGEFTDEQIGNASYFQIFKNTNNVEYIKTNRIVDNITNVSMNTPLKVKDKTYTPTIQWEDGGSNQSDYYKIQIYNGYPKPNDADNVTVPQTQYCEKGGDFIPGQTLLLVKNQGDKTDGIYMSPYNGVYLFVSAKWKGDSETATTGALTVTWQRPAMADTWAEFLGQSFFVRQTAQNWDSTATASGTINSTKLGFKPEEAIKIYPTETTADAQTFGEIFKTVEKKAYIRPFVGLESGMRFEYLQGTTKNHINDVKINTTDWFVEHDSIPALTPDVDTYSFTSFFKTSDENPFYAYNHAELKIEGFNTEGSGEYIHNSRILDVSATYNPGTGVKASWASYKWTLEDLLYGTIKETEVQYSGTISAKFVGLENEHVYLLTVTVQDTLGRIQTAQAVITIQVEFPPQPFKDLKADFICNDAAVEIDMSVTGVVLPSSADAAHIDYLVKKDDSGFVPFITADADKKTYLVTNASSDHITYNEGATGVTINYGDKTLERDSLLKYNRMRFSDNLTGTLYGPSENIYVLASEHSGLSTYFEGPMIRVEHEIGVYRGVDSKTICEVGLEPDTVSWKENLTKANDKRGQLYSEMAIYRQNGSKYVKGKEVIRSTGVAWRTEIKPVVYAMREDKGKNEGGQEINPPSDKYDYIDCDAVYEKGADDTVAIKEGYKNIRGAGSYNSSANPDDFGMGFCLAKDTGATGSFGFWSDKKLTQVKQADDSTICVESIEDEGNYWPENETEYYWCDESDYGVYHQKDVNATGNHSGRQELDGKTFAIQAMFQNFDPTQAGVTDERKVELKVDVYNPATTGTTGGGNQ